MTESKAKAAPQSTPGSEEGRLVIKTQSDQDIVARYREATVVANLCKEIVLRTTKKIGDRNYVQVEGWTSIAVAHGCIASVKLGSVREFLREGKEVGFEAWAEIRRQSDGVVLSDACGYVGDDEELWFGSHGIAVERWSKAQRKKIMIVIPKRLDYAIRAMAQTRAISRACRTAFSHVVVMMKENLETTPYEEVADPENFVDIAAQEAAGDPQPDATNKGADTEATAKKPEAQKASTAPAAGAKAETKAAAKPIEVPRDEITKLEAQFADKKWEQVKVHFGTNNGMALGELEMKSLVWYCFKWVGGGRPATEKSAAKPPSEDDKILRAACNVAIRELNLTAK